MAKKVKCDTCQDRGYRVDIRHPERDEKDYSFMWGCHDCEIGKNWSKRRRGEEAHIGLARFLAGQNDDYF